MYPSEQTPIPHVIPAQRGPIWTGLAGFGLVFMGGLATWIKEAGASGVIKEIASLLAKGWHVGAPLVCLALAWIAHLTYKAAREQTLDFRERAIRRDRDLAVVTQANLEATKAIQKQMETQNVILADLPAQIARAMSPTSPGFNQRGN